MTFSPCALLSTKTVEMWRPPEGEWRDATSYSKNCKERIPNVWECYIGQLRVVVIRGRHDYSKDHWTFAVYGPMSIRGDLDAKDLEAAKIECMRSIVLSAESIARSFDSILESSEVAL